MSAPATAVPILLDDQHRYTVAGIEYPSVTTILKLAGLSDFSAIPEHKRNYVLARGKAVHAAGHYLLENDLDESTLDPEVAPRIEALRQFLFHSGFEPIAGMIERRVFSERYGFCGTLDAAGGLPALGGKVALADWKCCEPGMSGTEYQTAAYLLCVPGIFHRAGIRLKADGTFSVHTYPPSTLRAHQQRFLYELARLRKDGLL